MARPKGVTDGVKPSGTSAALQLLAELIRRTDELAYERHAHSLLATASGRVAQTPSAFPSLLTVLNLIPHGDTGSRQDAARGAVRAEAGISAPSRDRDYPADDGCTNLAIEAILRPGWHVNARRPLQDARIGTTLRMRGDRADRRMAAPAYPTPIPEILRLGFQREPRAVYRGHVRIETTLGSNLQQRAMPARIQARGYPSSCVCRRAASPSVRPRRPRSRRSRDLPFEAVRLRTDCGFGCPFPSTAKAS
jgi:hypothetical protein